MEKIFYTNAKRFSSSEQAIKEILSTHLRLPFATVEKNELGKPYLKNVGNARLFLSVTHTADVLFIAFSDENVGVDAERLDRCVDYAPIVKKFPYEEQAEIENVTAFLHHWTAKESAIKWIGGSIAHDLSKLKFVRNKLYYGEIELPAHLAFLSKDGVLLAVCSEKDFSNAQFIEI